LLFALSLVTVASAAQAFTSAYISECLADNRTGLKDDDRERSAWIELGNAGRSAVNLTVGSSLIIRPISRSGVCRASCCCRTNSSWCFASGKDRSKDLAHLHTSFRLNSETKYLALVNSATNIVDELHLSSQPRMFPSEPARGTVMAGSV
jgi:hypothetical protein